MTRARCDLTSACLGKCCRANNLLVTHHVTCTPDVHYWGHQFVENGNNPWDSTVNFDDTLLVLNNPSGFTPALIDSPYDITVMDA